jgi:formylmethanofuran dehydrogenase subunit B
VEYSRGFPRYDPSARVSRAGARFRAALVVGSLEATPELANLLGATTTVLIGPRASQASFSPRVAIDTGVAGIHEGGTAYRTDEVPLRLRPALMGPRSATDTLQLLLTAVRSRVGQACP